MTLSTIEPYRARWCDADFRGIPVEQLQARALVVSEMVLDIIPQVACPKLLPLRRVLQVLARDGLGFGDATVARVLQLFHMRARQRVRPSGPERVDERQPCERRPRLTEIDDLRLERAALQRPLSWRR